jgi:hypothetical protein
MKLSNTVNTVLSYNRLTMKTSWLSSRSHVLSFVKILTKRRSHESDVNRSKTSKFAVSICLSLLIRGNEMCNIYNCFMLYSNINDQRSWKSSIINKNITKMTWHVFTVAHFLTAIAVSIWILRKGIPSEAMTAARSDWMTKLLWDYWKIRHNFCYLILNLLSILNVYKKNKYPEN